MWRLAVEKSTYQFPVSWFWPGVSLQQPDCVVLCLCIHIYLLKKKNLCLSGPVTQTYVLQGLAVHM